MIAGIDDVVRRFGLGPHPEGGYYRELYRDRAMTTILYALPAGALSPLHRLRTRGELWHFYGGAPVALHTIIEGAHHVATLSAEAPVAAVPPGAWQAARAGDGWALCGCTVAPAFDFADWELPSRAELLARLPGLAALVTELTRA